MSEEIFGRLHDGAIFVNVARGALADEAALTKWLQNGGHAVLDVSEEEPLPESSPPLRKFGRCRLVNKAAPAWIQPRKRARNCDTPVNFFLPNANTLQTQLNGLA